MELEPSDTSVRVDAGVLNKLMSLAGELLLARDQFRTVCARTLVGTEPPGPTSDPLGARATLVLFSTPDQGRMAIPLSQVDRIEEFDAADLGFEGPQRVARYRGTLLPLVEVSRVLPERRATPRRAGPEPRRSERVQVIVHTAGSRSVGLVVDRIRDVLEERLVLEQPGSRAGARASVVLRGHVTELVDVSAMLERVDPAFFDRRSTPAADGREG